MLDLLRKKIDRRNNRTINSIEEASNVLAEKKENIKTEVKAQVEGFLPTSATPEERTRYLTYCMSCFERVSWTGLMAIQRKFQNLAGTSADEVTAFLKKILILRIFFKVSYYKLAVDIGNGAKPSDIAELERIAKEEVKMAVEKRRNSGIPILGQ